MTLAPVAPVVVYVIDVIAVLRHTVCASEPTTELKLIVLAEVTVTLTLPVAGAVLLFPSVTLTRSYISVPGESVGTETVTLLPEVVVTIWSDPPLIV